MKSPKERFKLSKRLRGFLEAEKQRAQGYKMETPENERFTFRFSDYYVYFDKFCTRSGLPLYCVQHYGSTVSEHVVESFPGLRAEKVDRMFRDLCK